MSRHGEAHRDRRRVGWGHEREAGTEVGVERLIDGRRVEELAAAGTGGVDAADNRPRIVEACTLHRTGIANEIAGCIGAAIEPAGGRISVFKLIVVVRYA